MRWLIRLEQGKQPRFGESRADVLVWAVRPYVTTSAGRSFLAPAAVFTTLGQAHRHARSEAARHYHNARRKARP